MARVFASMSLVLPLVLSNTGIVAATIANISPHWQSRAHGQASSWTATWGDTGPYNVVFHPDTANPGYHEWVQRGIWGTSMPPHSMAWWPCTTTTYTQELVVDDKPGSAVHRSTATEAGAPPPCHLQPQA